LEDWTVGEKELVGRSRYTGNLTIGDLEMAEGMLYVDGDVTVTGRVTGKGAIVATGKITVTGSMETEADHAALVAKGDIKIHGDGPNSSKFYGLVYSEGSIDIARTTIMGAAVSKDTAGTTKLEDVVAVAVPELTVMDLEVHETLEESKKYAKEAFYGDGEAIGIREADGTFTRLAPNPDTEALKNLGVKLGGTSPGVGTWQFGSMSPSGFDSDTRGKPRQFLGGKTNWELYIGEQGRNEVKSVNVFDIELNTLISLDVELEMMYHTTVLNHR
jgi:cytoskeletal protein CcmA (bactofilin family)